MVLSIDKIELLKFYTYTTYIHNQLVEYYVVGDEQNEAIKLARLYDRIMKQCSEKYPDYKCYFQGNKTAFMFRVKETGTVLFIGYKDGVFTLGCSAYVQEGRELDLTVENPEFSDYIYRTKIYPEK